MRLADAAQDIADIGEAVKCLTRRMVAPSENELAQLK